MLIAYNRQVFKRKNIKNLIKFQTATFEHPTRILNATLLRERVVASRRLGSLGDL